jgi:ABC-type multidrug transport system ATPase subunit
VEEIEILRGVSGTIEAGNVLAIMGSSGAGNLHS